MSLEPERPDHPEVEERRSYRYESRWVGTWWAPMLVAFGILIWGLMIYFLIGHRERQWEYGTVPYIPGESEYSSNYVPRQKNPPSQVTLPGQQQEGGDASR